MKDTIQMKDEYTDKNRKSFELNTKHKLIVISIPKAWNLYRLEYTHTPPYKLHIKLTTVCM